MSVIVSKHQHAKELRARGNTIADIADYFAVSRSTIHRWLSDDVRQRGNQRSLQWKDRHARTCPECNTRRIRHDATLCVTCNNQHTARNRRGNGPVISKAAELLNDGQPHRWKEIMLHTGIGRDRMGTLIARMTRYGMIKRVGPGLYQQTQPASD